MGKVVLKKKAFTLLELLAVIVILAIVLTIAIISISSLIDKSRKKSLELSTELVTDSIEKDYSLGVITSDSGECPLETTNWDPNNGDCTYTINKVNDEPVATVKIVGKGKFDKLTAEGTRDNVTISETVSAPTLASKFSDGYLSGTQSSNYVSFGQWDGNPLIWRVVKKDSTGILVITENIILGPTAYNATNYTNNFIDSDIKSYLNGSFLTTLNGTLNSTQQSIITNATWNTSCASWNGTTIIDAACPSPSSTARTAQFKVGLLTIRDYYNVAGSIGTGTNYLVNNGLNWWVGSGITTGSNIAWYVLSDGSARYDDTYVTNQVQFSYFQGVRPAVVISPTAIITEGNGTSGDPYIIE